MEPFDDPVLGRLVWNAEFNEWKCEWVTVEGARAEISVDCPRGAVPVAMREAFAWLAANEYALRLQLAEQMLEGANDWRNEDEAEITAASFAGRVTLSGATFSEDGRASLTYYDGDIFGSHGIAATLTTQRTIEDAYIFG
jgi:hypothetical protein